jgi:hypothetical protein
VLLNQIDHKKEDSIEKKILGYFLLTMLKDDLHKKHKIDQVNLKKINRKIYLKKKRIIFILPSSLSTSEYLRSNERI